MEQIKKNSIQIYTMPEVDTDEDEDYKEQCKQLKVGWSWQMFNLCRWFEALRNLHAHSQTSKLVNMTWAVIQYKDVLPV